MDRRAKPLSPELQQDIAMICASCPNLVAGRGGQLHCKLRLCSKKRVKKKITDEERRDKQAARPQEGKP
jgi:hypothetical protein